MREDGAREHNRTIALSAIGPPHTLWVMSRTASALLSHLGRAEAGGRSSSHQSPLELSFRAVFFCTLKARSSLSRVITPGAMRAVRSRGHGAVAAALPSFPHRHSVRPVQPCPRQRGGRTAPTAATGGATRTVTLVEATASDERCNVPYR